MAKKTDKETQEAIQKTDEFVKEGQTEESPQEDKIKRKFAKLADYKAKFTEVKYKPQEWINMSSAFKAVTKLPGIPMGHTIMNFGKSDVGKTTMLIEAGAFAQKQNVLPVLIITENKWSWERAEMMGLKKDECISFAGIRTIEEGVEKVVSVLKDQSEGKLSYDLLFLWDSIGTTPSRAEWEVNEKGEGNTAMMVTAKVLRAQFTRFLSPKISETRRVEQPFTNTILIVNHAYTAPPKPPAKFGTLEVYGGDGIYLASTLVFRQGGVQSRSSKVTATKDKVEVSFGIKSALVVDKNHITNVAAKGAIICTDHGFILEDDIDEYKKLYRNDWDLEYDKYWDAVSTDE